MQCSRCHAQNSDAARFCEECGARIAVGCPRCGEPITAGKKFCRACGATLPADPRTVSPDAYTPTYLAQKILSSKAALEGERKQVTVLFADLKGSLELLADRDPEDARRILDPVLEQMMEAVHRYEGTVNQVMGDGIMALFGAPVAHEDHAVRACYAAVRMQEEVKRHAAELERAYGIPIQIRVGLNSGRVVVRSIGNDLRMDYTAVGETTHLAARMEQMAQPGTILATDDVRRLAEGCVRTRRVGPVEIKGLHRSIDVHEVLAARPATARLHAAVHRGLSPLVGRNAEIDIMRGALERMRGGHGEVVMLVGEAGIGKSRLLYEFRQVVGEEPTTYLEGRCLPYGTTVPFLPLIDMLRADCRLTESDSPAAISDKVRRRLRRLGVEAESGAPYLLHLVGIEDEEKRLEELTPEMLNAGILDALWQMASHGSRRRPLVLAFDDLHWIDRASEAYLATVIDRLPTAAILLLLTHRPGYRQPWMDKSYVTRIALRPLSVRDGMTIVQSVVAAEDIAQPLREMIVRKADGNPFFLEEMGRALDANRTALTVPDTIQGVLMARIDRLREDPKRLLQVASVLGREFSARLLEAVWGDPVSLAAHIDDLTRLEFLDEQGTEGGAVYAFRHSLIQEVAYDSLPIARRQALHAAVGEALEMLYAGRLQEAADRLAHHYARSTNAEKAVHYLRTLAQTSARAFAHAEAVAAAQAALAHVDALPVEARDPARAELAVLEAFSLFLLGRFPEALRVLLQHRECVERHGERARRGDYYFLLANTYTFLGELDEAIENARRSFEAAAASGDEATMGRALYVLSVASYSCGEPERGVEYAREALARLAPTGSEHGIGYAYWALSINEFLRGHFAEAREACSRARMIGARVGDPRLEKSSAWTLGVIEASIGEWAAGVQACKQGLDESPNPLNTALGSGFLGYAYLEGDQPGLAIPVLETAVASMSHFHLRQNHGWFLALLADGYRRIGDLPKASRLASEALEIAGRARFPFGVGWAQRVLGLVARDRGALADARAYFAAALTSFSAMRARFETARTHLELATVARLDGQPEPLEEHMGQAAAIFAELGLATYPSRAAAVASGDAR